MVAMGSGVFYDSILQFLSVEITITDSVLESGELDNLFSQMPDPPVVEAALPLVSGDSKKTQLTIEKELQPQLAKNDNADTKWST